MMYFAIFLIDFYENLIIFLRFLTVALSLLALLVVVLYLCLYYDGDSLATIEKYKKDPDCTSFSADELDTISAYRWATRIQKKKGWLVLTFLLTIFAPSPKALYTSLGLYIGQSTIEKVQDNPLFNKAYSALEQKLDEAINEQKEAKLN